eukprot:1994310-Prymnesium_polylepis.1
MTNNLSHTPLSHTALTHRHSGCFAWVRVAGRALSLTVTPVPGANSGPCIFDKAYIYRIDELGR